MRILKWLLNAKIYEEKCTIQPVIWPNVHKSVFSLCYLVLWNYHKNQKILTSQVSKALLYGGRCIKWKYVNNEVHVHHVSSIGPFGYTCMCWMKELVSIWNSLNRVALLCAFRFQEHLKAMSLDFGDRKTKDVLKRRA